MAGSMKEIKLRIRSVESTMQITKAMELVASSKLRRAKQRAEETRPYFTTLHECLTDIAQCDAVIAHLEEADFNGCFPQFIGDLTFTVFEI